MSVDIFPCTRCKVEPIVKKIVALTTLAETHHRRLRATGDLSHQTELITANWEATNAEREVIKLRQRKQICPGCKWHDRG